jgi:hypothetical protein
LAARVEGKSWAAPVYGTVDVVDKATGKVLVSKPGTQLAKIPKLTRHYSYIVGGQEKFITNQWRLRPGPYVRESSAKGGEFKAQFQLAKGKSFNMLLDPTSGHLALKIGGRKVPVYSLLSSQGVSDDQMRKAWGDDVFEASKAKAKPDKDVRSFYAGWKGSELDSKADPHAELRTLLSGTRMDPLVAKVNLGRETDTVDHDILLRAAGKLVDVSAGRRAADPIDSLKYKELWTAADQFAERIEKSERDIASRVRSALGNRSTQDRLRAGDTSVLRDVVAPDLIQRPLFYAFSTSLAANGKQTNPLSMLADRQLNYLLNDKLNGKLPPFINTKVLGLNFGIQGIQYSATSTVAENQTLSNPMYVHSIPSNNDNQDIVSMGSNAALTLAAAGENVEHIGRLAAIIGKEVTDFLPAEYWQARRSFQPQQDGTVTLAAPADGFDAWGREMPPVEPEPDPEPEPGPTSF